MWCTIVGFLFNSPIMGSVIIAYEKVRADIRNLIFNLILSIYFSTRWIGVNTPVACFP